MSRAIRIVTVVLLVGFGAACAKRQPATNPTPAPAATAPVATEAPAPAPPPTPPAPATRVEDRPVVPVAADDGVSNRPLEELNKLLKPAFFPLDSAELDEAGRSVVTSNADLMRKNQTWAVTIEGHADERGTAEYNLALGERRALAVKTYLVSLGIAADRLRTVSYGKEFPFDPGHNESAWSKNRRAHFQLTAK
ncbi:MAG TPA: peptidoglycan-associated lipoprotein Pal [Vicinamibacterales bacterium]|nr:peptidoglycan-associated lipoprotein Pal [Vicinamibacterales bacterium]